jgi:hypothetical protein
MLPPVSANQAAFLVAQHGHVVGGPEVGQVVVEETHSVAFELPDLLGEVLDLAGENGVDALAALIDGHEGDQGARTGQQDVIAARLDAEILGAESIAVKAGGAGHVDDR